MRSFSCILMAKDQPGNWWHSQEATRPSYNGHNHSCSVGELRSSDSKRVNVIRNRTPMNLVSSSGITPLATHAAGFQGQRSSSPFLCTRYCLNTPNSPPFSPCNNSFTSSLVAQRARCYFEHLYLQY
ncbi:hypothetical protein FRC19_000690 [Serendipita sp. 401]|nr:hypothetical protein FRC19_000690 [Serendipita sp. 401]